MKTNLPLWALLLCCAAGLQAQIQFQPFDLAALKQRAQKEDKLLLLVFTAEWSGPCRSMQREVFANAAVGHFYNAHFLSARVDADKNRNFAAGFDVEIFPDFVVLNAKGEKLYQFGGYHSATDLVARGEKALRIASGGRSQTLQGRLEWCADMEKWQYCNEELLEFVSGAEWQTPEGATLLLEFAARHNPVAVNHYIKNLHRFDALIDSARLRAFRTEIALQSVQPLFNRAETQEVSPNWAAVQDSLMRYTGRLDPALLGQAKLRFFRQVGDWANFFQVSDALARSALLQVASNKETQILIYRQTVTQWLRLVEEEVDEESETPNASVRIGMEYAYKYLLELEQISRSAEVYELLIAVAEALGKEKEADTYYDIWKNQRW